MSKTNEARMVPLAPDFFGIMRQNPEPTMPTIGVATMQIIEKIVNTA